MAEVGGSLIMHFSCMEAAAARLLFKLAYQYGLTAVDAWSRQHMLREMGVVMDDE